VSKKRLKMHVKDLEAAKESTTVQKYIGKGIGEFCAMKMCEANRRNPRRLQSFVEGLKGSSKHELRENVVNLRVSHRRYKYVLRDYTVSSSYTPNFEILIVPGQS
jgi:hypothetical protein